MNDWHTQLVNSYLNELDNQDAAFERFCNEKATCAYCTHKECEHWFTDHEICEEFETKEGYYEIEKI